MWSKPACSHSRTCSSTGSGSGPHGTFSVAISTVTLSATASKSDGRGSSWLIVPPRPECRQSSNTVCFACSSSSAKQSRTCPYRGPLPPAARYASTISASGATLIERIAEAAGELGGLRLRRRHRDLAAASPAACRGARGRACSACRDGSARRPPRAGGSPRSTPRTSRAARPARARGHPSRARSGSRRCRGRGRSARPSAPRTWPPRAPRSPGASGSSDT